MATDKFRDLFEIILTDTFAIVGEPPCSYDIRAIGSVGRGEPVPFSDLEFFILIESEEHRDYFKTLLQFLELQVVSLGETEKKSLIDFTCIDKKRSKCFYLDGGGAPVGGKQGDLMGTAMDMASSSKKSHYR